MKKVWLFMLVMMLVATVATAAVIKKTFDDCEKEGLQHSWIYSLPDEDLSGTLFISTGSITWRNVGEVALKEVADNNAVTNTYDKIIRSRKCRNCAVVHELKVFHLEEWRIK